MSDRDLLVLLGASVALNVWQWLVGVYVYVKVKELRKLLATLPLTLLLFSAASVQAQEQPDRSLRAATYVFAATAAADWTTTGIALSHGAMHEANPFLQWAHDDTATTVIAGAAMDAVSIYAVRRWIGPTHPRAVAVVFFAQSALRLYFVQKAAKQTAAVRR